MTYRGGTNSDGVIFEYTSLQGTYTDKIDFNGYYLWYDPYGSLMQASDGNLYGMTSGGGASGHGSME